ncbi:MAG: protein kinase [Planctomycetota bacterium]
MADSPGRSDAGPPSRTPTGLLAEAMELSPDEQAAFLAGLRREDSEMAAEVASLLEAHHSAEAAGFLVVGPSSDPAATHHHPGSEPKDQAAPSDPLDTIAQGATETEDAAEPSEDGAVSYETRPPTAPPLSGSASGGVAGSDSETIAEAPRSGPIPGAAAPGPVGAPGSVVADDYEIRDKLGAGGMGTVYRAWQRSLKRWVALKIIPSQLLSSSEQAARFYLEAEAAAGLDHPGIVRVEDVGETAGVHYYAMALVEGGSLAKHSRGKHLFGPRRAAEIMEQVCRAVQHAHDRAVIHRDIKPANIMLDLEGQPRLTDFGLAKLAHGGDELTVTGQVMGTPSFMAPEQAEGKNFAISTRTDVYSLGATLYALLAGRPPFEGGTLLNTLRQVQKAPPAALSKSVPADLRTICEKCLEKQPDERYASAAALADDLRSYLRGYPIAARKVSAATHAVRWAKRNPAVASLLALVAVVLVGASIVSTAFGIQARAAQAEAEAAREVAETRARDLESAIEEVILFASENELGEEPGMQVARQTLLEAGERYYEKLIASGAGSPEKLAAASLKLGSVQKELGQWDDARASLEKAIELQESLVSEAPGDAQRLLAAGKMHNELARLGEAVWSNDGAALDEAAREAAFRQWSEQSKLCVEKRRRAAELEPENTETKRLLANGIMNAGWAESEQARSAGDAAALEDAAEMLAEAQRVRRSVLSEDEAAYTVRRDLAYGLLAEADAAEIAGGLASDAGGEDRALQRALELRTKAAEVLSGLPSFVKTSQIELRLAFCYQLCGNSHFMLGDVDAAIAAFQEAQATMEVLLLRNPSVVRYRTGLAAVEFNLAQIMFASGNDLGYGVFGGCQNTLVEGLMVDPNNPAPLEVLVDYTTGLTSELAAQGRADDAVRLLRRGAELLERIDPSRSRLEEATKTRIEGAIRQLREAAEELVDAQSVA